MIRFIGDVHGGLNGHMPRYDEIIRSCSRSIQVGDFGVGFMDVPAFIPPFPSQHRFIRGNHDNPVLCKTISNFIPDGHTENGMMFVGGAWSTDASARCEGVDWWRDEELTVAEFNEIINRYEEYKPRIMITHDCPETIAYMVQSHHGADESRTNQALEAMFNIHQPEMWLFGHHHRSFRQTVNGTDLICLAELEYIDLDIK